MSSPTRFPYNMPPPWTGSGGVECDGFSVNDGTTTDFRQPVSIGDPTTWGNAAAVAGAALAGTEMGVAARTIESAANAAGTTAQVSVGTSAVQLTSASPAANRRRVKIKVAPAAPGPIYIGFTNAVTTTTGYRLDPGEADNFEVGPALTLYAIASAAGNTAFVLEAG